MAERICSVPECGKRHFGRGWCRTHYARWERHGDVTKVIAHSERSLASPAERFATKYRVDESGCWLWTAGVDEDGYGRFAEAQVTRRAHRWSYEHHVGPIPPGLEVDHLCFVPGCVNPMHLEAVTPEENSRRRRREAISASARNRQSKPGRAVLG